MKRMLQVLVAESEESRFLRERVPRRRRIRHVATEQECLDLAHAGAGDVMLVDIEDRAFCDPDFVSRVRFVSRSAFPILGVASHELKKPERWMRCGMSDLIYRENATPFNIDRALRHWVKYQRLQLRVYDANRRALRWWKDLVTALDEVRLRMEKGVDSLEAYLTLLEAGEGDVPSLRHRTVDNARKQVAELSQLAQDLDVAARTIQVEGIEKSKEQPRRARGGLFTAESLIESALEEERSRSIDPPVSRYPEEHRRYGT